MGCRGLRPGVALMFVVVAWGGPAARARGQSDDRLAAAKEFVEKSDRYLHHDRLRRGMEGYGITVLEGTQPVRFKARVVSVVSRWGPHQDVILAWLSEQNLEHTGIIAGMSGSPVFFKDPRNGKFKLVGAVAYGWRSSKDPLCGIQPITQMLAAGESFRKIGKPGPIAEEKAAAPADGGAAAGRHDVAEFLKIVLAPEKKDFITPFLPAARPPRPLTGGGAPELIPLATPLMVSGVSRRVLGELARQLEPMGIVPVASGGANPVERDAVKGARLEPGSGIAVQIVSGDADMSAVGTVTDVIDGRVLAFGHSFFGEGDVRLPMGPAYVHTVVAGLFGSFKLSSGLGITGTLERDEQVAVAGRVGPKPASVPMNVSIEWPAEKRKETFRYELCDHRLMTAMFSRGVLMDSAWAWHELPEYHTVRYALTVDFGKLGKYRAGNVSSGGDVYEAASDMIRPISAMLNNPYGPRVPPKRIDVSLTIEKGDRTASMLDFKLDGEVYRPGETVTGALIVRPRQKGRQTVRIQFALPEDLPEGSYKLAVCDYATSMRLQQSETPHRFSPRTTERLFEALQYAVSPAADQLYLRLPLPDGGGMAIGQEELPDLPGSRAAILADAKILDTKTFRSSLVRTLKTRYIITGSAAADFRVQREPDETLLRK